MKILKTLCNTLECNKVSKTRRAQNKDHRYPTANIPPKKEIYYLVHITKNNTCFIMDIGTDMKCTRVSCVDRNVWIRHPLPYFVSIRCRVTFLSVIHSYPPQSLASSPLLNVQNIVYCQSAVSEPCHCITELHFIYQIIHIPSHKKIWQNDCIIAHGLIFFLQQYKKCLSLTELYIKPLHVYM